MADHTTPQTPLGRKRGPKPSFTWEDVVRAALECGIRTFTMAEVATRVGVVPSALYRHFSSREEIIRACFSKIVAGLPAVPRDLSWQDLIRFFVDRQWETFDAFPGLSSAVYEYPGAHIYFNTWIEDFMRALAEAGMPGDREYQAQVVDFVGDSVLGVHISIEHMRRITERGVAGLEQVRQIMEAEGVSFDDVAPSFTPSEAWLERGTIDWKIEFIIAAVEAGIDPTGFSR